MLSPMRLRLQSRIDALEVVNQKHKALIEERGEDRLSDTDTRQIELYRSESSALMEEIEGLTADVEAQEKAEEMSRAIRRAGITETDQNGDGVIYRTFAEYARDVILTRGDSTASKIQGLVSDRGEIERAATRLDLLKRTPANTLSSDVAGLSPAQHIAQIFQIIDSSRPIVASANRSSLVRGTLTYPSVVSRPVVAVQGSEKTEAGNTKLQIDMLTTTASVYLGGGDLSWQAVNWSDPNALDLWFQMAAADYALKTETDAATALKHSAFTDHITTMLGATPTYADFMTAVGAGYAAVYSNSKRTANTVYMAPDRYGYLLGMTSTATSIFTTVNGQNVGPLNIVVSRGMDAGAIIVGDSAGLLVAETSGAPVELRVTEPAIGGYEVGVIGAFEAVVVDPGAFSQITTAS